MKFDYIFISPYELQILFYFQFFCSKKICFWKFYMGRCSFRLCGVFLLRFPNLKMISTTLNISFHYRFGKVCRWLNMYYSKIRIITFLKVVTMSIWIILKNLVLTYRECNFCQYWDTQSYIHPSKYIAKHQTNQCWTSLKPWRMQTHNL